MLFAALENVPSFRPFKIPRYAKRLVPWQHPARLLAMMIRVYDRKHDVVHESFFRIPTYTSKGAILPVSSLFSLSLPDALP